MGSGWVMGRQGINERKENKGINEFMGSKCTSHYSVTMELYSNTQPSPSWPRIYCLDHSFGLPQKAARKGSPSLSDLDSEIVMNLCVCDEKSNLLSWAIMVLQIQSQIISTL